MHATRSQLFASLAVAAALLGLGSMPSSRAGVVFGNLGANGSTGSLTTSNTGITNLVKVAQVFTTPELSPDLLLSSITLGAFTSATPAPLSLQVFRGDSSGPFDFPDEPFATSINTQTLTENTNGALFTWNFANVQMSTSTTYWIIPPTNLNWSQRSSTGGTPTEQNSSGYVYGGSKESDDGGNIWEEAGSVRFAVSVQAVPEPSALVLTAAALGLGCFRAARRRRA